MFVCCVFCQVQVSAKSWSLVQRSPTDCGALYVINKSRGRGGHSPRWATVPEKINDNDDDDDNNNNNNQYKGHTSLYKLLQRLYWLKSFGCFFSFGTTALSGRGPLNSQSL
jgi:hypothetical protein